MDINKARIIKVYTIIAILFFMVLKKQYVVSSMYMACAFLVIFYFLISRKREQLNTAWMSCDKKRKLFSGILTLLGLIMLGVAEWRKSGLFDFSSGVSWVRVGYIGGLFLVAIPCVILALYVLVFFFMESVVWGLLNEEQEDNAEVGICLGIIALSVLLFLISSYPGMYHGDGTNVLRNIDAGRWSDWHPITYYLFVYLCMGIIKHPFIVILVQSVLFFVTQYLVLRFLKKYTVKNTCYLYTFIILTAGIPTFFYLDVFYKDTPHFIGLLGFSVSLLAYLKGDRRKRDLIIALAYAFFMACMRHMSILIVMITLLVAVATLWKEKERQYAVHLFVGALLVCVLFFGVKTALLSVTETEKNPKYVSFTIPLHMLGSYAASGEQIDDKTIELMNEIMPVEKWEEGYLTDPYLADTLSREYPFMGDNLQKIEDKGLYLDIIAANWRYLCNYPLVYIRDLFNINTMVWEMGTPADGYEWLSSTFVNCDDTLVNRFPEYDVQHSLATGILAPYIDASKNLAVWKMVSYRGGFFNFLIICACVSIILGRNQRHDWIVGIPAFISGALLLISIPAQDPRFILPAITMGCFILAYAPRRISNMNG